MESICVVVHIGKKYLITRDVYIRTTAFLFREKGDNSSKKKISFININVVLFLFCFFSLYDEIDLG